MHMGMVRRNRRRRGKLQTSQSAHLLSALAISAAVCWPQLLLVLLLRVVMVIDGASPGAVTSPTLSPNWVLAGTRATTL
jgi:hypothetical protein